jgi:hypothetical protein
MKIIKKLMTFKFLLNHVTFNIDATTPSSFNKQNSKKITLTSLVHLVSNLLFTIFRAFQSNDHRRHNGGSYLTQRQIVSITIIARRKKPFGISHPIVI